MTIVFKDNVVLLMARYIECVNALSWLATQPEAKRREYFDMEIKEQLATAVPNMRSAIERAYTFEAQDARLKWSARFKQHLYDARLMFAQPDAAEQWWLLNQSYNGRTYVDKTPENSQPAIDIPADFPPTVLFMEHKTSATSTLLAAYAIQDGHVLVLHVDDKGMAASSFRPTQAAERRAPRHSTWSSKVAPVASYASTSSQAAGQSLRHPDA